MPEVVSAMHLANVENASLYEPARSNTFKFTVTNIDNLIKPGTEDILVHAQNYLEMSVVSVNLPKFTQTPIVIRRGNSVMKAAGIPEFNEGSLVIKDYIGADGKSILLAWQALSYDVTTDTVGYMSDYKKDCWLTEYDISYSKILHQWLLHGCWVSDIQQDDYTVEEGSERNITATIQYDYAEIVADGNE